MNSNSFLAREPWKRSRRTRSASAASEVATRPPSPRAKRFLVGKKLNVEASSVAIPGAPKAWAASSMSGSPKRRSSAIGAGRPKRCTGMIARVAGPIRRSTAAGSRLSVSGSMSAKTGVAPTRAIASAVAKKVKAGQMTSSPRPIPSASRTSTIASVPLATPIECSTPRLAAASASKASSSGPRMKRPESSVRANAAVSSGIRGAYCALTSTCGIGGTAPHLNRAARAEHPGAREEDEGDHDGGVEVVDVVAGRVPARPARPPDPPRREGDPGDPGERGGEEPPQRQLEHPGRDRDERAHERRQEAERNRHALDAVEPALGPRDPVGADGRVATVALEQRLAAVDADQPADDRAERVPGEAGERDGEVGVEPGAEVVPEERDLTGERAGGERAAVEHRQLARHRQHGRKGHEREDGEQAVVSDERGHRRPSLAAAGRRGAGAAGAGAALTPARHPARSAARAPRRALRPRARARGT